MSNRRARRRLISQGTLALLLVAPFIMASHAAAPPPPPPPPTQAPAGFDNQTNGFEPQAQMDADRAVFDETEQIADGLGPLYNAQSCRECHQNPVSGTISQISELRAGSFDGHTFTPHIGGSLIHDRAIDPAVQARVFVSDNVVTFRTTLNIAGDGFIEALPDAFFLNTAASQPPQMRGTILQVPVLEGPPGTMRIARFGWKDQHASLLSFASDAYLNEMGITNPLNPNEDNYNGNPVDQYNTQNGVAAMQDPATPTAPFGGDIQAFTNFMRALKAPPRDTVLAAKPAAQAGAQIFNAIGCSTCHVPTMTSAPAGTVFNGGQFVVPAALGNVTFHPYSDFLLHNIGTGDGVVQAGPQSTMNQMRTPPLWGLRTRTRLMHDGLSATRLDAILRHSNQAEGVVHNFLSLGNAQQSELLTFLDSL